jgi:hypothetical protein
LAYERDSLKNLRGLHANISFDFTLFVTDRERLYLCKIATQECLPCGVTTL